MIIDGISLTEGSYLQNLTIVSGLTFPASPNTGELFYKTNDGLYCYSGAQWDLLATSTSLAPLFINTSGDTMTGALTLAGAPTQDLHAATKAYVDLALTSAATGLDFKESVRIASTDNIVSLHGTAGSIDGIGLTDGTRILVKNQTDATANGIYVIHGTAWSRATDFDGNPGNEVTTGAYCYVEEGTTNGGTGWVLATPSIPNPITIGSTALTFAKITSSITPTVPYDVATFCSGKPTASEKVLALKAVTAFTIPANFTGSVAIASVAATASAVFSVKKNGTQVTTITFAAAGTTGTIAAVGSATNISVGDVLTLEAPATADATLADIMFTIKGTVA